MDVERFRNLCAYVGFDADSAAALRAFHENAEPRLAEVVDDFYAAIERDDGARRLLTGGSKQIERLKVTLRGWLERVLRGPHDAEHVARHAEIGRVHVRIGMPQELMFMAMSRIRTGLTEIAEEVYGAEPTSRARTVRALNQILDIELAIMLDGYRHQTTERVVDSEEQRHREIIENVPVFAIVLDEAGKILLWNSELEEVTGYSRQEMLGRDGREIVALSGDHKLPLKNGGHRLARWRHTVVRGPSGASLTYALGVDVTEERDALRNTIQAERLAAVGRLSTGLAHEVRNPLNAAMLQIKVLEGRAERGVLDPEATKSILGAVQDEIRRIENLLSDFLSFAQPRPLKLVPSDLNALLAKGADELRPLLGEIQLRTELDPQVGRVEIDPAGMRQVVTNLLRNAIEASDGRGEVWLRSRAADSQGFVSFEVEDHGPGFAQNAPIFDAFYTTKPAGTGLGLSVVHRIVGDHGGSVKASSGDGCTRFVVRLPQHSHLP